MHEAMTTIMIVDDAAFLRKMLSDMIGPDRFETIIEAQNGQQAVQYYKHFRPDLVMMDITMPDMDGLTALSCILAFDPGAYVIMCSALGQQSTVLDAIQAGAKDFIVKPFLRERVLDAIKRLDKPS